MNKRNRSLIISFNSPDPIALMHALSKLKPLCEKPPNLVTNGFKKYEENLDDWIDRLIPTYKFGAGAYWGDMIDYEGFLSFSPGNRAVADIVKVDIPNYQLDPQAIFNLLESIPWTLAGFYDAYSDWDEYYGEGFADKHFGHGWACAFKGEGHNRLVSRRWLEYGPWRVLKGANDTTLIQFHDLEADSATALEQAKVGHKRMGISDTGGFIQTDYAYDHDIEGFYKPEDRRLKIVVIDRIVSQREMLNYCAARHYQVLGKDKPLDKVAFVFIKEEEARKYLHELWLRELECWTFINSIETRIDIDYQPVVDKPDWVLNLPARTYA